MFILKIKIKTLAVCFTISQHNNFFANSNSFLLANAKSN